MAHTISNTVKEELEKRGMTPKYLMDSINKGKQKQQRICKRTLTQIINNKEQDVTIKQLHQIAKVFKDTDKKNQKLKWYNMIKED